MVTTILVRNRRPPCCPRSSFSRFAGIFAASAWIFALYAPASAHAQDDIITTPPNRVAPPVSRINPVRVEARDVIGRWSVNELCSLSFSADTITADSACSAPWRRAARWRLYHSRFNTTALQVFSSNGARIWSGLFVSDTVVRGPRGATLRRIDDPATNP